MSQNKLKVQFNQIVQKSHSALQMHRLGWL